MRESIGSLSIFAIVITFIMLFTAYLAISVNYAKAYRLKDRIISMIEEKGTYQGLEEDINTYLTSQGYTASKKCPQEGGLLTSNLDDTVGKQWKLLTKYPSDTGMSKYCIYGINMASGQGNDDIGKARNYYKVVTFFKFDLPGIGNLTTFTVSGDTKLIYEG